MYIAPATPISETAPEVAETGVRAQLKHAGEAQAAWASTPLSGRLAVLRRFRHLIVEKSAALSMRLSGSAHPGEFTFSQLIPLADAVGFLEREAAAILKPRLVGARGRSLLHTGVTSVISREPLGTVLVIGPSNYPLFLPGVQVIQALAAGNAVALKPGLGGTAAAEALRSLLSTARLDERLLQVLPEEITSVETALDAGVAKVFLTGSVATGKSVLAMLAPRLIPATMELSGCDAMIVMSDADLAMAASAAAFGLRLNKGATCIAPRRIIVHRSLIEQFEARLLALMDKVPQENPPAPLVQRLAGLFRDVEATGGHFLAGGLVDGQPRVPALASLRSPQAAILDADIFAPVSSLMAADTDADAFRLAACSSFGLGASIFSRDTARAAKLAWSLSVGVVIINDVIAPTADARLPFGGRLRSGFGVTRGAEGLVEMTAPKVISTRAGKFRPHHLPPSAADGDLAKLCLESAHAGSPPRRLAARMKLLRALLRRAFRR